MLVQLAEATANGMLMLMSTSIATHDDHVSLLAQILRLRAPSRLASPFLLAVSRQGPRIRQSASPGGGEGPMNGALASHA